MTITGWIMFGVVSLCIIGAAFLMGLDNNNNLAVCIIIALVVIALLFVGM